MTTILVTRPQPDADALAALLREKNFNVLVDPLFTVEFASTPPEKQTYQALVATSRNAIRALVKCGAAENFSGMLLFTVGEETEAEARRAGFMNIKSADSSSESLGKLVTQACVPSKGALLYLAGKNRKPALEAELTSQGFGIELWEAYVMHPVNALSAETLNALRQKAVDAVTLFSERTGAHFLQLTSGLDSNVLETPAYLCLSKQIAIPLREKGLTAFYSPTPSLHALIDLLMQKYH